MAKEAATRAGDSSTEFLSETSRVKPEDDRESSAIMTTFYIIAQRNRAISTHEIVGSSSTMTL